MKGYEDMEFVKTADVGHADARMANHRNTQAIGTPDEIVDRIKSVQWAVSLGMLVVTLRRQHAV